MAITFRTDDATKWGDGKGGNLLPVEVDLSFWELLSRIVLLEADPAEGVGVANITLSGSGTTLTFTMTDATTRGPFLLPTARFVLLGEWEPDTSYPAQAFITNGGQTYLINVAHVSESTFDPGAVIGVDSVYGLLPFPTDDSYDVGFYYPGTPGAGLAVGDAMFARVFSRATYLPAGLPGSVATLEAPPEVDSTFAIHQNSTEVGSLTFLVGEVVGTFEFIANVQFNGTTDRLRVLRGAALDATAIDLAVNFVARVGTP